MPFLPKPTKVRRPAPWARTTTSAVVLMWVNSIRERKIIFENYGSAFSSFDEFNKIYEDVATSQPYTAMVLLLNREGATKGVDSVFYYRARDFQADVRACSKQVWKEAMERVDPKISASDFAVIDENEFD